MKNIKIGSTPYYFLHIRLILEINIQMEYRCADKTDFFNKLDYYNK